MWEFYTSLLVYLLRYQVTLTITAMKLIWWTMSMYIIACVDYESGDCVRVAWRRLISVMSMWSRNINNLYWSTLLICDRSPVVKAVYQYTKLIVLKHRWVFDPHRRKYFSYIFNYFISINTIIIIIIYINIAIVRFLMRPSQGVNVPLFPENKTQCSLVTLNLLSILFSNVP